MVQQLNSGLIVGWGQWQFLGFHIVELGLTGYQQVKHNYWGKLELAWVCEDFKIIYIVPLGVILG
jgi:hypothetical protein